MKQPVPEGTPIGEIEASLEWLLSHTTGFMGAILVRIYTGEGFILIHHGRPVGFSFRMGNRVLRGMVAKQLFESQDVINASLHRYNLQEFQQALTRAGPEILIPDTREVERETEHHRVRAPVTTGTGLLLMEDRQGEAELIQHQVFTPVTTTPDLLPAAGTSSRREHVHPLPLQGHFEERLPEDVLDWIFNYPGVTAAAIFRDRSIVDYRGEISLDDLVEMAEDTLLTVGEILCLLSTGPLSQLTLRASGNNITIAPFEDGYLLILTEPDVKLGQIRRLVQDSACAGKG